MSADPDQWLSLLRGVCPILEVPFTDSGGLDVPGFARVVDHVLGTGVTAVMWPGFASEFLKLDDNERAELRAVLLDRTARRDDVAGIVSVSAFATYHAVRHAVAAAEAGADAINLLPPFQMSVSPDAVRTHIADVLAAVRPLPVVLQHAPALTGTQLTATEIAQLAGHHPNLRMVKVETTPPGPMISALGAATVPLPPMVGYAGVTLVDALRRGAVGVQPGCSFTEIYLAIWDQWTAGDQDGAQRLYQRLLPYIAYWMQNIELLVQAEKTITKRRGLIASDHCRAPGHPLDAEETRMVDRFLDEFTDLLERRVT